jgi:hypothetical protein
MRSMEEVFFALPLPGAALISVESATMRQRYWVGSPRWPIWNDHTVMICFVPSRLLRQQSAGRR